MNIMYDCFIIYYYIKINWYYFWDRYNYFIFLNFKFVNMYLLNKNIICFKLDNIEYKYFYLR